MPNTPEEMRGAIGEEAGKAADHVVSTPEERLAAQYANEKAALRPICDKLIAVVRMLGKDITVNVLQAYVAVIRRHQFAVIRPSTDAWVDLGLVLPGFEQTPRLQVAGAVGSARTTHRIALHSPDDVDDDVIAWLKVAYDVDASPR
jgi:hypothetical protein